MAPIITLVRHGNAAAAEPGQKDSDRPLTELGRHQATVRRKLLAGPSFDFVISSSSRRAFETAEIISGGMSADVLLDELAPQHDGCGLDKKVNEMFLVLKYAPARTWLKADNEGALRWKGAVCAAAILRELNSAGHPKKVLVATHSIFIPMIALALCPLSAQSNFKHLLELEPEEAGAINIDLSGGLLLTPNPAHNSKITLPAAVTQ